MYTGNRVLQSGTAQVPLSLTAPHKSLLILQHNEQENAPTYILTAVWLLITVRFTTTVTIARNCGKNLRRVSLHLINATFFMAMLAETINY